MISPFFRFYAAYGSKWLDDGNSAEPKKCGKRTKEKKSKIFFRFFFLLNLLWSGLGQLSKAA